MDPDELPCANARLACAATGHGIYLVYVSDVYAYFRTTGNEADGERYQRLQSYKRLKENGDFPETPR